MTKSKLTGRCWLLHLHLLGVTSGLLTTEQRESLDDDGFVFLSEVASTGTVRELVSRFDELITLEGEMAGIEVHQQPGTARLGNLVDKSPVFHVCWSHHPLLLAAVAHILAGRRFKLNSLNARAALPGQGHQRLHTDALAPTTLSASENCNSISCRS